MAKKIDMTGWVMKEHGVPDSRLTVIEEDKNYITKKGTKPSQKYWKCLCECGKICSVGGSNIRDGRIRSCGCLSTENKIKTGLEKGLDITGWKLSEHNIPDSKWTVIERVYMPQCAHNKWRWKVQCECGNISILPKQALISGKSKSCGKCKNNYYVGWKMSEHGIPDSKLTILKRSEKRGTNGAYYYICKCECGNIKEIILRNILDGTTKSCGCYFKQLMDEYTDDLTGKRFGLITVLEKAENKHYGNNLSTVNWKCQCDCGTIFYTAGSHLKSGRTKSCGCLVSQGEYKIKKILNDNHINYETQKTFSDLKSSIRNYYRFDFFIDNKFLLEYDGQQHFYYKDTGWDDEEHFKKTQESDKIKNEYAKSHNIPLKRIPYWDFDKITLENIMSDKWLINI
jgi:hypothetical protein